MSEESKNKELQEGGTQLKIEDNKEKAKVEESNKKEKSKNTKTTKKQNGFPKKEKSSIQIQEGELLEFRAKRLLYFMGYLPIKGVLLKTSYEDYAEDITDLDVYGIYIHKDFREKNVWVDCKSGGAKPLERISWIKGIKQMFSIDDVLFIKGGIRTAIKHFARESGIQVLDLKLLDKIESDFKIDSKLWLGSWSPDTMFNITQRFSNIKIPNTSLCKKITYFMTYEYWSRDIYTRLKKCISALTELAKIPLDGLNSQDIQAIKWAIYHLIILAMLAVLGICRELYFYNDDDKRDALREGMLSGEMPIKKRTEIVVASYKLAFQMVKAQVPEFIPPADISKFANIQPPKYYDALLDLIIRISNAPLDYYDILRALDLVLMEYDLNSKEYDWDKIKDIGLDIEKNKVGIKTFIHFICHVTDISKEHFRILN